MRTNDTQFNYLFEKIYELVELADFDIDDEDLLEATKSVIDNLELDERFYHKKKNVTDDLDRYYEKMSETEFIDEAQNYWEDGFGEVIDEIQDYMKCDFKKPLREPFEETN